MARNNIIALDFDGTVVRHEFPKIGKDIGAVPVIKSLIEKGYKIVLNTMRSGKELEEAVQWFKDNGIELYGINETPGQKSWTSSPKVHADFYIDDHAVGCPMVDDYEGNSFVDWNKIAKYFGV